jgi:hypothetical protein
MNTASVAILKIKNDSLRVLLLSYGAHKPGDKLTILPAKEPDNDVFVTIDRDYYFTEEKKGRKPSFRVDEYDSRILKTAWGVVAGD